MSFQKLLIYFVIWRSSILLFTFLGINLLPLQTQFLGGSLDVYVQNPYLWSFVNFDGEHFLSITQNGYQSLTYFYFPLYPYLVSWSNLFFQETLKNYAIWGILLSHASLILGLLGFIKLVKLNYSEKITETSVILLLLFPTSFYFSAYYSESLYFCLSVWTFYLIQKNKYVLGSFFGALASATRLVGLTLAPALILESFNLNKSSIKKIFSLKLTNIKLFFAALGILLGLFSYMYYLYDKTGDPLEFFHSVTIFGDQRSNNIILLPQVFYRYIYKIIPNVNYDYFPAVYFTLLEFATALFLVGVSVIAFFKLRISFAVYLLLSFILPTLSGSFSSLPRYALVIFPMYILISLYINKLSRKTQLSLYAIMFILLGISTSLFTRGYWIS